jgi:hypothetical protein
VPKKHVAHRKSLLYCYCDVYEKVICHVPSKGVSCEAVICKPGLR